MNVHHQDIWPHEPKSLLPLLRKNLPHSLAVHSLIASNDFARPTSPISQEPCPQLEADDAIAHVWCTFPPSALSSPPPIYNMIAIVPRPQEFQTRSFCSAEANLPDPETEAEAVRVVVASHLTLRRMYSWMLLAGGVHERWLSALLEAVGTKSRVDTYLWLSPEGGSPALDLDEAEVQRQLEAEGLILDHGRACDAQIVTRPDFLTVRRSLMVQICDTREAQSPISYYYKQLPHTTVLRPKSAPDEPPKRAVCWIMTHAAGDQGVLYTLPEWRRKGLAKIVTAVRLKEAAKSGVRGFVWVFAGNAASNALWENLGWEKQWTARWVYFVDDEPVFRAKK